MDDINPRISKKHFMKNSSLIEKIKLVEILKRNLSIRSKESKHKILRKECINLHINVFIESSLLLVYIFNIYLYNIISS